MVRLTDFEKDVYRAVMEIPFGQTRSYQWVAHKIKRPYSARAVGNVLNKNPLIPFIPCHRVIASDGSLGGYSGGLEKKREMLKKEQEIIVRYNHVKSEARSTKSETNSNFKRFQCFKLKFLF